MTEQNPRAAPAGERPRHAVGPSHGGGPRPATGAQQRRASTGTTSFTQTVDGRRGVIRPGGQLTAETAALLRETVEALHRSGHTRVRLDLGGLQGADDAGLDALAALQRWVSTRGRSLVVIGRVALL